MKRIKFFFVAMFALTALGAFGVVVSEKARDDNLKKLLEEATSEAINILLYEYEEGKYRLNIKVSKPLPIEEFLKLQGRFRHLFKSDFKKEIEEIQCFINVNYDRIIKLCTQV